MSIVLKEKLYIACENWVDARHQRILKNIEEIRLSLLEESKSSAGDKHETGRAMLQIERENAGKQLQEIEKVKALLRKVDITTVSKNISLGSLVYTSNAIYFVSISIGAIVLDGTTYFGVAPNSPIGIALLGKKKGDSLIFNGQQLSITQVG